MYRKFRANRSKIQDLHAEYTDRERLLCMRGRTRPILMKENASEGTISLIL